MVQGKPSKGESEKPDSISLSGNRRRLGKSRDPTPAKEGEIRPSILIPGGRPLYPREWPTFTTATLEANLIEFATLAISLALLIFGVSLLFTLKKRGGPELALARLLADAHRRTVFLVALCTSLAAPFGIGLASGLEKLVGISTADMGIVTAALFALGAAGIFVLMADALRTAPLTLEEGWNLKETAARVSNAARALPRPSDLGTPPYAGERWPRRPEP